MASGGITSFCGTASTSLTDSDITATYGSTTSPGILTAVTLPSSARDGSGLLQTSYINATIIPSLNEKGILPLPPSNQNDRNSLELYLGKEKLFTDSLKSEYCFYYTRYTYTLQQLISNLVNAYGSSTTNTTVIQKYLTATQNLNQKLNDLTQITNEIAKNQYMSTQQLNSSILNTNVEISANIDKLRQQKQALSSDSGVANLYKKMVDYTDEKASYSSNLLNLYSFLNIFILGLLIYLYRSSSTA